MELYNFIVGALALVVAAATLYYTRVSVLLMRKTMSAKQRAIAEKTPWWRSRALAAMGILVAMTWAPWVYGLLYAPPASAIGDNYTYGGIPDGDQYILANFKDEKPDKRLIGLVFHYNGLTDAKDAKGLQKSAVYDYNKGSKMIIIDPDEQFRDEVRHGVAGTNYVILEVPKAVSPDQFSTIHQAENLGGNVIFWRGKNP